MCVEHLLVVGWFWLFNSVDMTFFDSCCVVCSISYGLLFYCWLCCLFGSYCGVSLACFDCVVGCDYSGLMCISRWFGLWFVVCLIVGCLLVCGCCFGLCECLLGCVLVFVFAGFFVCY